MSAPIVFMHQGRADYLPRVLRQARLTNPDRPIVFLGDAESIPLARGLAECYDMEKYRAGAARFIGSYIHLSHNPFKFTRETIVRWFVLRDFCRSQGVTSAFHADSDVLLFASVTSIAARLDRAFGPFEIALHLPAGPFSICGHACLWLNLDRLDEFCVMVEDIYSLIDATTFLKLVTIHQLPASSGVPNAGMVSDMTLLEAFFRRSTARFVNAGAILEAATLDHNIYIAEQDSHRFEMVDDMKRLVWQDGVPYGVLADGGALVRFDALHCQGAAKWQISALTPALRDEGAAPAMAKMTGPEDLIYAVYHLLLDREPDPTGLEHWKRRLATDLTPLQLVNAFIHSKEFRGQFITDRKKQELVVVLNALFERIGRPQQRR